MSETPERNWPRRTLAELVLRSERSTPPKSIWDVVYRLAQRIDELEHELRRDER